MNEEYQEEQKRGSLEAEQAVLGSVLIDSRCAGVVLELVRAEDFTLSSNKDIFTAIHTMYHAGQEIDPVTVIAQLKENGCYDDATRDYILQLMEITPTAANVERYAGIVAEEAVQRDLAGFIASVAADHASTSAEKMQKIQAKLDAMRSAETQRKKSSSVDLFDTFLLDVQTQKYKPIKTGMRDFDNLLGGGLDPQSLVMIGAAPGMGKTVLCQQIFETMAANGHEVIFLNLEMSREQLLARSLSRIAARSGAIISPAEIMRGYAWTDTQKSTVMEAATKYRAEIAPRMAYNPDGTGAGIDSIIETLNMALYAARRNDTPAPVVVLDYLQLVQARERQDSQEAIKEAVMALKNYAIEGHTVACAILAFNRSSNSSGKVTLESGRDTSAIEYSADTLLGLNYAALEEKGGESDGKPLHERLADLQQGEMNADGKRRRRVVLKLLKKRMTEAGKDLKLWFDGETATYTPIRDDENECQFRMLPDSTPIPKQWTTGGNRRRSQMIEV